MALALCVLVAAACGNDEPVPFQVKLRFEQGPLFGCGATSCDAYGMACGATLSVRIVDAETIGTDAAPGSDAGSSVRIFAEECLALEPALNLCSLRDVDIPFEEIPTRTVQVQVAIWEPPAEGEQPHCPKDVFNLQGIPLDLNPQPAFGGVAYLEAGDDPVAEVALACRQPELIDKSECLATNRVTVRLDDMQTLVPVRIEDAPSLSVSVGEPRLDTGSDPPAWVLQPTDTFQMELVQPSPIPPVWNRDEVPEFEQTACVLVAQDVAQPTTAVTCTDDLTLENDGRLDLSGEVLPETVLAQIRQAAGIAEFPTEGLVIGRVVDHLGAPLDNVLVRPVPNEGVTVQYVDASRTSVGGGPTSTDGFFVSTDAPFGTMWEADHIGDDRTHAGQFQAGLIDRKVSVVVIQMTPP